MRKNQKFKALVSILVACVCFVLLTSSVYALDPMKEGMTGTPDETDSSKDPIAPAGSTLLPDKGDLTVEECEYVMRYVDMHLLESTYVEDMQGEEGPPITYNIPSVRAEVAKKNNSIDVSNETHVYSVSYTQILGCAITTGNVKAWMIPFFIRYILEFIIGLAGLIAVGGIVYGGYLYLFAGLSDDKDKGKNAIKNGILGFVLVLTSWAIVNIVISLVTL